MGVVIEICIKYPRGRTWKRGAGISELNSSSAPPMRSALGVELR
jgi:hypothetical protein